MRRGFHHIQALPVLILAAAVFFSLTGCVEEPTSPVDNGEETEEELLEPVPFDTEDPLHWGILLQIAFRDSSEAKLDDFLDRWQQWLPPVQEDTLTAFHKAAYDVFRGIYQADTSSYIGNILSEYAYQEYPYHVIQHSLTVAQVDDEFMDSLLTDLRYYQRKLLLGEVQIPSMDTLVNFQSTLPDSLPIPLYFDPTIEYAINYFLEIGFEDPRIEFLRHRLNIIRGLWGRWHFVTIPNPYRDPMILINSSLNNAIIQCRFSSYTGGVIHMQLQGGSWIVVDSMQTWAS